MPELFQSTLPAWGETSSRRRRRRETTTFQSTLPAWGETLRRVRAPCGRSISIHSPRMGRDWSTSTCRGCSSNFNPLSPHGERRPAREPLPSPGHFNPLSPHGERRTLLTAMMEDNLFQSTLPAWGETLRQLRAHVPLGAKISIHSPRMGRDDRRAQDAPPRPISIHSPRMGRDWDGETFAAVRTISIHSPRMGRDSRGSHAGPVSRDFNPLSPHGERRIRRSSTPSPRDFNPLSPHGERPGLRRGRAYGQSFQSTLPAWGETGPYSR